MDALADPAVLQALANAEMPFGRYQGTRLLDLPEAYLVWFQGQGWPRGKLGAQMALALEVKINGLEPLLQPLRDPSRKGSNLTGR